MQIYNKFLQIQVAYMWTSNSLVIDNKFLGYIFKVGNCVSRVFQCAGWE